MTGKAHYFCSSIGRKQIVGLTGLGLSVFVLTHMLGNLLIFIGPQAYNEYSHSLISNPLIYIAEAGLLAIFLTHLGIAMSLVVKNKLARPQGYAVCASGEKATELVSKSMWIQGLVIFVFTVLHLITFKFGQHYVVDYGKGEIRDLYRLVYEVFHQPIYVGWYIIALITLGMHLSHGIKSAIQTWGVHHPKHQCLIKAVSFLYATLVAGGFLSQPLYIFLFNRG